VRQAVCCGDITEAVHGDAGGEAQDPAPADADLGDEHRDVGGIRTSEHHTRQGGATDMWVVSFTILAVSLLFLEVLCILAWVHIYGSVILLALRAISRPTGDRGDAQEWPTVLQRNFWP
jgi:hypothetical protein